MNDGIKYYPYNAVEDAKTCFLYFHKDGSSYCHHELRLSSALYDNIINKNFKGSYIIGATVLSFPLDMSIAEILVNCAIYGYSVDFIDIFAKDPNDSWSNVCVECIDTHKVDVDELIGKVELPCYFVVESKKKDPELRFLVIDAVKNNKSKFSDRTSYINEAIVCGFNDRLAAARYCENMNKQI